MPCMPLTLLGTVLTLAAPVSTPTLAVEDTMHTEVSEVLVRAPRVTLEEILARVERGEARRDSAISDQQFTAAVRLVRDVVGAKEPRLWSETVWRVYRKRPDKLRTVLLKRWAAKPKADQSMDVEFSPGTGEQMVNFAFDSEARRDYKYKIVGRDFTSGHLVYQIAFEPRSPLAGDPSGVVWVDTNDFVIAREEITFKTSPVPLLLKGVKRMVVERQRVAGHWVLARMLARIEATVPLPGVGKSFDFAIRYDDYRHNVGLDDALFPSRGSR